MTIIIVIIGGLLALNVLLVLARWRVVVRRERADRLHEQRVVGWLAGLYADEIFQLLADDAS